MKRFAAAVTLAGILTGLPVVLLALNAGPLDLPSWDALRATLTAPDDGTVVFGILKTVGWLIWAALTMSVVIEAAARIRGRETAPTITGLGIPQQIARALLGALIASAVALPTAATAAPPGSSTTVAVAVHGAGAPTSTPPAPAARPSTVAAGPATTEKAPVRSVAHTVARGETLSSLAQRYLGDWRRFPEIATLNEDLLGGRPDFLRPGWQLRIPTRTAGTSYVVQEGDSLRGIAQALLGDADRYQEIVPADGSRLEDPDLILPGWTLTVPGPSLVAPAVGSGGGDSAGRRPAPAVAAAAPATTGRPPTPDPAAASQPAGSASRPTSPPADPAPPSGSVSSSTSAAAASPAPAVGQAAAEVDDDAPWAPILPIGVGAVLAAGVVTLLGTRRRDQQRRRRPGQRLPHPPTPATEQLERSLRAGADPLSYIDAALRALAVHFAGTCLPTVRAVRVTPTQVDLYLHTPAVLPQPWTATVDATVWTAPITALPETAPTDVPSPYPSLLFIGRDDEDGYVLLDLEVIAGLHITGPADHAQDILAALAVDLATSRADDIRVTVIGFGADLEDALQTGRIRYLPSLTRLLDELEQRAAGDRAALTAAAVDSLHQARARGAARDAWTPEIILTAAPLTDSQQQRLTGLLDTTPRLAIAAITSRGENPVADWVLDLDATDPTVAVLHPIQLRLRPQYLPADSYRQLLQVADLANVDELVTVEAATADEPRLTTPAATTVAAVLPLPDDPPDTSHPSNTGGGQSRPAAPAPAPADQPAPPPTAAEDDDPVAPTGLVDDGDGDDVDDELGPVQITVLGPVTLTGARGTVEKSRQARLTELAVYLALHPGATPADIDDAIWPNRRTDDNTSTRHPATTRLRNWLGLADDGQEFFPRHQDDDTGYVLHTDVHTDIAQWDRLITGKPLAAATEDLAAALHLVRGRPFAGQRVRYYAWADPIKQRLIAEISDASYELGRRRYMVGDYRGCEQALAVGLDLNPGLEALHRLRILACHDARDPSGQQEAIDRLLAIADELDIPLEPETEDLLAALTDPTRLDDARTAI